MFRILIWISLELIFEGPSDSIVSGNPVMAWHPALTRHCQAVSVLTKMVKIKMATSSTANDGNFVKMTFSFECSPQPAKIKRCSHQFDQQCVVALGLIVTNDNSLILQKYTDTKRSSGWLPFVAGDFEACLQRLQWRSGQSSWRPFRFSAWINVSLSYQTTVKF